MHTCYEHMLYAFLQVARSLHVTIINQPMFTSYVTMCEIHGMLHPEFIVAMQQNCYFICKQQL